MREAICVQLCLIIISAFHISYIRVRVRVSYISSGIPLIRSSHIYTMSVVL